MLYILLDEITGAETVLEAGGPIRVNLEEDSPPAPASDDLTQLVRAQLPFHADDGRLITRASMAGLEQKLLPPGATFVWAPYRKQE